MIEALRQHARITEVPVTFLAGPAASRRSRRRFRYAWNFSKAIGKTWLR